MGGQPPAEEDFLAVTAGEVVAGSRIAGYLVQERIGRGGMAVVFRGLDERLGRVVALKVLAPVLAEDDGFRQRFIHESRAAAAVDDPHIIPIFEAGEADGVLFIAMRYVADGDVRSLVRRGGSLLASRAASIISPVASALDAAHAAGLVHRDVKPANMLIDTRPGRPDHVYLSDFGLSKGALSSVGLTGTGLFLGTPDYVSPEQITGKTVDGRSDQYALACAAFEILTGKPPFSRDHGMAVIYAHTSEPPPALSARRPGLPSSVDPVVARALAKDPADRYDTCQEFAESLRAALGLAPYDMDQAISDAEERPATQVVLSAVADKGVDARANDLGLGPSTVTARARFSPAAVEPAVTTVPRRRRRWWWWWAIPGIASLGALGLVAGLLVRAPRAIPPVLRPAGLTAGPATSSSASFSWLAPATGPLPDKYVILQNGAVIGTVRGTVSSYEAQGLAPASSYRYQVMAVRGGRDSPKSPVLAESTLTPPISAARLDGTWAAHYRVVGAYPYDPNSPLSNVGKKWTDTWTFTPNCAVGPCDVTLAGAFFGYAFHVSLARAGAVYSGTGRLNNYSYCVYTSNKIRDTVNIHIRVKRAGVASQTWAASSWAGTVNLYEPYSPAGNCYSDTFKMTVRSSG
jgi:Protein kinase domain/Fibronectin type III domain